MRKILSVKIPMVRIFNDIEPIKLGDTFVVATKNQVDMVKVARVYYRTSPSAGVGSTPTTTISILFVNPQGFQYKFIYWLGSNMKAYYTQSLRNEKEFSNIKNDDIRFYANIDDYYTGDSAVFDTYEFPANIETDSFYKMTFGICGRCLVGEGYVIRNNTIRDEGHTITEYDIINGIIDISVEDMINLRHTYSTKEDAANVLKSMVKINGFDEKKKEPQKLGSVTLFIYDDDDLDSLHERLDDLFENFSEK